MTIICATGTVYLLHLKFKSTLIPTSSDSKEAASKVTGGKCAFNKGRELHGCRGSNNLIQTRYYIRMKGEKSDLFHPKTWRTYHEIKVISKFNRSLFVFFQKQIFNLSILFPSKVLCSGHSMLNHNCFSPPVDRLSFGMFWELEKFESTTHCGLKEADRTNNHERLYIEIISSNISPWHITHLHILCSLFLFALKRVVSLEKERCRSSHRRPAAGCFLHRDSLKTGGWEGNLLRKKGETIETYPN